MATGDAATQIVKKERDSNLELYRIIVMLLIVAHHYVVNSDLFSVIESSAYSAVSGAMLIFGAWGKTGINCFLLITGYFMCKSSYSLRKFVKLYLQIIFYSLLIYGIFCVTGHDTFSPVKAFFKLFPFTNVKTDFINCFLLFYLFIPFINVLINNLDQRQHGILTLIMLFIYTFLPSVMMRVAYNYVTWFFVLYLISSYIRLYGTGFQLKTRTWGMVTLLLTVASGVSVYGLYYLYSHGYVSTFSPYFFISDSNKLLSIALGVSSFMWFKNIRIPHSRLINVIASTTFGVLLIHANSDVMREWLWNHTIDCTGHFGESLLWTTGYAAVSVIVIFTVCSGIDWFRLRLIEPRLMSLYDRLHCKVMKRRERKGRSQLK